MDRQCIIVIMMLAGLVPSVAQNNDFFTTFEANNQSYSLNVAKQSIQVSSNLCNNKQRILALFDTNEEHRIVAKYLTEIFESQNISQADVWVNLTVTHDPVNNLYTHSWGREVFKDVWNYGDPDANCVKYPDFCCARMSWENQVYAGLKDSSCYTAYYSLCAQERLCPRANCSHGCKENATHFTCTCRDGYILAADRMSCQEVDLCNNSLCTNTSTGGTCPTGHTLSTNGTTCLDIDECVSSPCQYQCNNTAGSYYCTCPTGHTLSTNGTKCLDVDECQGTNQCQGACTNMPGSYWCGCHHGYQDINKRCMDVDECVVGQHNCSQTCHNSDGGYNCSCHQGYTTPDDNSSQCHDINECHNDSTCQHTCVNTDGSYYCTCNKCYDLDPDNRSCHDIDECQLNTTLCGHFCNNTPGSFYCSCPHGYTINQDRRTCALIYRKCPCLCSHLRRDDVTFHQSMAAMRHDLVLNLRTLSASARSKTSVEDRRTTARSLGCVGLVFMVSVVMLLVGLDVSSICHFVYTRSRHCGHG